MNLTRSIDKLIISVPSWRLVTTSIWVFFVASLVIIFARSFVSQVNITQTALPIGAQYQLKSFTPFDHKTHSKETARAIGFQTVIFIAGKPVMVYLFSPDSDYPVEGQLLLTDFEKDLSWSDVASTSGVWVDQSLILGYGAASNAIMSIGAAEYKVRGAIKRHTFAPAGLGSLIPMVIVSKKVLEQSQLVQPSSRIDYFYFTNSEQDSVLMEYKDAFGVQLIKAKDQKGINRSVTHFYDWLDILLALTFLWLCYGLFLAMSYHQSSISDDRSTCYMLGVPLSLWYVRLSVCLSKIIFLPLTLSIFGMVFYQGIEVSTISMLLTAIVSLIIVVCLSYRAANIFATFQKMAFTMLLWLSLLWLGWFQYAFNDLMQVVGSILAFFAAWLLVMMLAFKVLPKTYLLFKNNFEQRLIWFVSGCRLQFQKYRTAQVWMAATIVVFVMILFLSVSTNIINSIVAKVSDDSPNVFMINISEDQVLPISVMINQGQNFYPMIKGRLRAINGIDINVKHYDSWTQSSALKRDLNLTYLDELPNNNSIVSGQFPGLGVSVESRLAKGLKLEIGDRLTFDIYGDTITLPVSSTRKVDWSELTPNFFMIFPPESLNHYPATYLTSFRWGAENQGLIKSLLQSYPSLSFFFIDSIIESVDTWLVSANRYIALFSIFIALYAGYIYYIVLLAGWRQRNNENRTFSCLGMSSHDVKKIWLNEQILMLISAFAMGFVIAKCASYATTYLYFGLSHRLFLSSDVIVLIGYVIVCILIVAIIKRLGQQESSS